MLRIPLLPVHIVITATQIDVLSNSSFLIALHACIHLNASGLAVTLAELIH